MESVGGERVSHSDRHVLLAKDLHKSYGRRPALRGLSFSLTAGRILGFLGPNGAGKTTSIRILTTILEPDAGHFWVNGIGGEYPNEIRKVIGVLPESLGLPRQITGLEYLTYFARLYGRTASEARRHSLSLLEEVGLQTRGRSLVGTYSRGMRQRLGIARALVNDPVVLFLDEPTLGLDPRGQQELLSLVKGIARGHDAGIILCSHVLSEVESICDDVLILMAGQVVATGPVDNVMRQAQPNVVRIHVPEADIAEAQRALGAMSQVTGVTLSDGKTGWLGVQFTDLTEQASSTDSHINNMILGTLISAGIPILGLESGGERLQDVFLHLTEEAST